MQEKKLQKIKISQIIENQIPEYILESNPNFADFLKQYYISQEYQGSPLDILENINYYSSSEAFSSENLTEFTILNEDLNFYDDVITVESTTGWPKSYGLLKIDDEIITYTGITSTTFTGCVRGFCGVESFNEVDNPDTFVFMDTVASAHDQGSTVQNLSNLFLQKFFEDFKYQYAPGFENVGLSTEINTLNLSQYVKDFYRSKGTDKSFKILFDILFGVDVSITKPSSQLFTPSDGQWVENRFLVVEDLSGDIRKISKGVTLKQNPKVGFAGAQGIVYYFTDIPKRNNIFYSKIGFDLGTLSGKFSNTATTKLTSEAQVGSVSISVDSTVGFPKSGKIYVKSSTGLDYFNYSSKTLTQFLGCVGLGSTSSIGTKLEYGEKLYEDNLLYGTIDGETKYFSVSNVVSGIKNINTRYLSKDDKINIKSFGYVNSIDPIFTDWIYNIANKYEVVSYDILSSSQCEFVLNDYSNIYKNDIVGIVTRSPGSSTLYYTEGTVDSTINGIEVIFDTSALSGISTDNVFIRKKISTAYSPTYSDVSNYVTDVQNSYINNEDVYVSSSCLPDSEINVLDNSKTFDKIDINIDQDTITISNHNYYSGQLVNYETIGSNSIDNLVNGRKYFIKKIDGNTISLCYNKSSVYKDSVISIGYGSSTSQYHKLIPSPIYNKKLSSQNLLKKFPLKPKKVLVKNKTPGVNGGVGLFLNGVEALDAKSEYNVYYGPIEHIEVTNSTNTLNVIDPPSLVITDDTGSGVQANLNMSGSIKEVLIDDKGFRFLEDPKAYVIGGNGKGSNLDVRLTTFNETYSVEFSSTSSGINTTESLITFQNNHNLVNGDSVSYSSNDQTSPQVLRLVGIGTTTVGITTSLGETSSYYVGVVSERSIKLFYTNNDSILGINTVNLISYGDGNQTLTLNEPISVIGDIRVVNQGFDYRNKKIYVDSEKYPPENYLQLSTIRTGINTVDSYIFAKNHNFSTGDIVEYSLVGSGTSISGISTSNQYYVLKVDNNKFRLSESSISTSVTSYVDGVGIVTTTENILTNKFLQEQKYVKFTSVGVGTHIFKYPNILVKVTGLTAIGNTTLYQRVKCLGSADSVFVYKGGSSYGTEDVFNYEKQPDIEISYGSGAKIEPIVNSNGNIIDYVLRRGGSNYVASPEISVSGVGTGAILKPVLTNGTITSISIVDGGVEYDQSSTKIEVIPVGYEDSISISFRSNIKSWNVNAFELHRKEMTSSDDGVILESLNLNYGNRYINYTLPRELRVKLNDNVSQQNGGYIESSVGNLVHSPIVGWSYDGNPIYGPYGYSSPNSSSTIKRIVPGYTKLSVARDNRPSTSYFPLGFFNEDYEFVNTGDLDEHNGRFCITPEFPKGVYAYFCPISSSSGSSAFQNSREPVYPYIIGNTFRNEVDTSNFKNDWDSSLLESKDTKLLKNLTPYVSDTYEFLDLNSSPKESIFDIKSIETNKNKINSIEVVNPGTNYKVGEFIRFDDSKTGGSGAEAYVSSIVGKAVTSVVGVDTTFYKVKFDYSGNVISGITSIPHNLSTGDVIKVASVRSDDEIPENDTTDSVYFKRLLGLHQINVFSPTSGIVTGISSYSGITVGFTTFIELSDGNLNNKFQVNDIVGIKTEFMLVLNVDDINNRLRVLRGFNPSNPKVSASSGVAYTTGDTLELKSTKFNFSLSNTYFDRSVVNKKSFYFDPNSTVGLGTTGTWTTYTVGVGESTSNLRRRYVKEQRIYIQNHGLLTGDKLLYDPGVGIAISVSTSSDLSNPIGLGNTVFAINRGRDFIGLSTTRVGLGSTNSGLYFVNTGSGSDHNLVTNFGESLIGDIQRSYAIVSLGEGHGLSENDEVTLEVIPNQTITKVVKFNLKNRKLTVGSNSISSSGITTGSTGSSLTIVNHGLENGSKVIYQSNNPALPLENDKEYYVIKVNDNQIRLSETLYGSYNSYEFINLTTTGVGIHTLSYINPKIDIVKGNILKFDLSNSTLSDFEFKFFEDKNFQNEFVGTGTYFQSSQFETEYFRNPGTSGAYAIIKTSTLSSNAVYYSIKLRDISNPSNSNKIDFYPDTEVSNYSKIVLKKSNFNLKGLSFDVDSSSTKFNISILPSNSFETSSYNLTNTSVLKYTTTSKTALGPINEVEVSFGGVGYLTLPDISTIRTSYGEGAQLSIISNSIGSINRYEIYNSTYEIPSDYTVRPILDFPIVLKIKDNYKLSSVGISSGGKGYADAPTIIAIDQDGNEISGLILESEISGQSVSKVNIIENNNNLNKNISIIAIDNGNGYIIEGASFNSLSKTATLILDPEISSEEIFKISAGTKIFVEGLESYSGILTTTSYNSSSNEYKTFSVVGVNSSAKTVDYIIETGNPGNLNLETSNGFMIFEKDLAKFTPRYVQGNFINGETIIIKKSDGSSEEFNCTSDNGWNEKVLKINYKNKFSEFVVGVGDTVFGKLSLQNGKIDNVYESNAESLVDFSYVNSIGWEKNYGKLSVSDQKLSDNVYYQKMSYDIKTTVSPTEWKTVVDSLNHTSGFKSFGSVIIISEPKV